MENYKYGEFLEELKGYQLPSNDVAFGIFGNFDLAVANRL
jgi:hypothetical protein